MLFRSAGARLAVRLRGSDAIALSAYDDGNRLIVHLVNYAPDQPPKDLQLGLGARWKNRHAARLLTPDGPDQELVVQQGAGTTVKVPQIKIYGVVIAE